MPWETPTLREVRSLVRDNIRSSLPGADATVPNSVLRVLSDSQGALCHLTLQYIDWLALQLLPDTAEHEWLDRHGDIWLTNADGSTGRKVATLAEGEVYLTGIGGTVVPIGTRLVSANVEYETTDEVVLNANAPTPVTVRALDPGAVGNLLPGATIAVVTTVLGLDSQATVVYLDGGTDEESDDDLRIRVLERIRQPPMGGAEHDYVRWAKAVPGVTRAWAAVEMGIGTITVRFLMDVLRADDDGWPQPQDIEAVKNYIDKMRPVTVKDCFVVAPIKQFIDITILDVSPDDDATKAEIEKNIRDMLFAKASPGATIYAAWISYAIMSAPSVVSFNLITTDDYVMQSPGHMAVLGTILYEETPEPPP